MKPLLQEEDYEQAAEELGCEVEAIKAVADIESAGEGFLSSGEPKILFEAHHFSRLTRHRYDYTHPNISSLTWNRALYKGGLAEHTRLAEAVLLDRSAALQSASWGKFQIMGFNYPYCGYKDIQEFINDMYESEAGHLKAFVGFINGNSFLKKAIQNKSWADFARNYNGPGYAANKYDQKMFAAYLKHTKTQIA